MSCTLAKNSTSPTTSSITTSIELAIPSDKTVDLYATIYLVLDIESPIETKLQSSILISVCPNVLKINLSSKARGCLRILHGNPDSTNFKSIFFISITSASVSLDKY